MVESGCRFDLVRFYHSVANLKKKEKRKDKLNRRSRKREKGEGDVTVARLGVQEMLACSRPQTHSQKTEGEKKRWQQGLCVCDRVHTGIRQR
jgi:hypothetical protein